jgi:hypothetical protein
MQAAAEGSWSDSTMLSYLGLYNSLLEPSSRERSLTVCTVLSSPAYIYRRSVVIMQLAGKQTATSELHPPTHFVAGAFAADCNKLN